VTVSFPAPTLPFADALDSALQQDGFAVLSTQQWLDMAGVQNVEVQKWYAGWDALPTDHYLRDGGRYRRRRHSCFVVDGALVTQVPHRPHWQPVEYNALHGGMQRNFEPIDPALTHAHAWVLLLTWLGQVCSSIKGVQTWYVEAHQFRIDTTDGIGRPTPEGAHRDGVDLVAVFLVDRKGVKGGETRVFEAAGPRGQRFTLTQPWALLLLDDARVIHESTPIQPECESQMGHRDTLVVTLRAGAFQDDLAA
jgi:hypothetical protein